MTVLWRREDTRAVPVPGQRDEQVADKGRSDRGLRLGPPTRRRRYSFQRPFPDMVVKMDHVSQDDGHAIFRWTWTGTNTGPGGTGRFVRINGYEEWTMGASWMSVSWECAAAGSNVAMAFAPAAARGVRRRSPGVRLAVPRSGRLRGRLRDICRGGTVGRMSRLQACSGLNQPEIPQRQGVRRASAPLPPAQFHRDGHLHR